MYQKGTIVLIPFPFTDLSGSKIRPAVILFSDIKSSDIVVVFITSKSRLPSGFAVHITPDVKNGIKVPSIIICDKIATLDKKIIIGKIGSCDISIMKAVDIKLGKILGLQ